MEIKIKKKKPMPAWQKVFYIISAIFLLGAFIYLGTKDFQAPARRKSDNISFSEEYGITEDNIFQYKNTKETLEILKNGSGIIFFAFPENKWAKEYAFMLNDTAKKMDIKELYYYNFKAARSSNNHIYNQMVETLKDFLPTLDTGVQNIFSPSMAIVKNGNVIFFDSETAIINGNYSPSEYWTNQRMIEKEAIMQNMLETYKTI